MTTSSPTLRAAMGRRRALQALLATTCSTLAPAPFAQTGHSVRVVVPVGAAAGLGGIVGAVQHAFARVLGQTVTIDRQSGVGGIDGTSALVRSAPDGFTLGFVASSHVMCPNAYRTLPFDPIKDITPIAMIGNTPTVLVCNPNVPTSDAAEMLALLKARPGRMSYGSSGHGSLAHLDFASLLDEAGVKANHVPFEGIESMLDGLIGGRVAFAAVALASVQGHLKTGALRALGVSSAQRVAAAPDTPTMLEQGLPCSLAEGWFALVAPRGLAPAEVKRLNEAAQSAFAVPEVVQAMAEQGNRIRISSPQVAAAFIRAEVVSYATLAKKSGIGLL